jgi:hypothetical protein
VPPAAGGIPIIGASRLDAGQLAGWFGARRPASAGAYAATVPVETLARLYLEEGEAEKVTGDIAFVQGIVETGWYGFTGSVAARTNNFAGIGATDAHPHPATFPDARTGVRAQVQHLRAYADPAAYACSMPPLRNPCVDPRFDLVSPKGKAATWDQMGNGNWATAPAYAALILALYREALAYNGVRLAAPRGRR